jgi:hypothetical protein
MHTKERYKLIRDINLLRISILKWERLADNTDKDAEEGDCALCTAYYKQSTNRDNYCKGCPIKESTGQQFCEGSPYDTWNDYIALPHEATTDEDYISTLQLLALGMVKYLQDLLENLIIKLETIDHVPSHLSFEPPAIHL